MGARMWPSLLLLHALAVSGVEGSAPTQPVGAPSQFRNLSASASGRVLSPVGLFPIWENTAEVLDEGRFYLGSNLVGVGLPGRVQVGLHPLRAVSQIPNLHAKVLLLQRDRLQLAAHVELLAILDGASDAFSFSNFTARLTHATWVAPVGASATWSPVEWLFLHFTGTAQAVTAQVLSEPQVVFGASARAEFRPFLHHAFVVHAAEVGFFRHDFWNAGASYRYQRWIFEGSVGLELRRYRDGFQAFPVAALGVEL